MSPRFYSALWIVFAAAALIFWIAGSLTMFVGVVFGFIAFGLVFTGMMCVLPTQVAHEHERPEPLMIEIAKPAVAEARRETVPAVGVLRSV